MSVPDLNWVDEFICNVKPYIFVRLEDHLLIKRPNTATKLNPMGARILFTLLQGASIRQLLDQLGHDPDKITATAHFLQAVKQYLEGSLGDGAFNPAVESVPFSMDFSRYPVLSELAVTYRCNLKCRFCYAGCNGSPHPPTNPYQMNQKEMERILWKLFFQAKVPSVSFTGGEPLLYTGLFALITYAKELGMRVNLITNGTLVTEKVAAQLANSGLDSAQVSVEGVTAATHDTMVQQDGAFQKTLHAIQLLKEKGIHTHTNTTITGLNLLECLDFPVFVKQVLGHDKFSMNLVIPTGSGALGHHLPVKYTEIGSHLQRILATSQEQGVEFMWYSPVPMCMFNSIVHQLGNKGCSACDGLISIAPNGDVLPCASCADPVGNLLRLDFDEIWQGDKAIRYRDKTLAHPGCRNCQQFHICNGACPLYWQFMGFDELTPFIEVPEPGGFTPIPVTLSAGTNEILGVQS